MKRAERPFFIRPDDVGREPAGFDQEADQWEGDAGRQDGGPELVRDGLAHNPAASTNT